MSVQTLINLLQMGRIPNPYRAIVGDLVATIDNPIMTRSVREYLWGYQDPLLHELKKLVPELVWDDEVSLFGEVVSYFRISRNNFK